MIDTHCHLDHIENLDQEIQLSLDAGVTGIVAQSVDLESCHRVLRIKDEVKGLAIYPCLGIHPCDANLKDLDACCDLIRKNQHQLAAIGEIGLDYFYKEVRHDEDQKEIQRKVFRRFCKLAKELSLPVVVHARGAVPDSFQILVEEGVEKAVFHWYDGSVKNLAKIIEQGYFVSVTPNIGYNEACRRALAQAPIEQTLMETDSPVFFRNRQTGEEFQAGPKDVVRTLESYAVFKNITKEEALKQFNDNAVKFFGLKI